MKRPLNPSSVLTWLFLGTIAGVPLLQMGVEAYRGERPAALAIWRTKLTSENLRRYERGLEEANWAGPALSALVRNVQYGWLRDGAGQAVLGRDGWLFYGPGVRYVTQRAEVKRGGTCAAEAVRAIVHFRQQLTGRGIQLVVVPIPNKETVYPEKLARRAAGSGPILCPETKDLLSRLRAEDITVVDLFEEFAAAKAKAAPGSPGLYLAQDSHWSPDGVAVAARAVARRLLAGAWLGSGEVDYQLKPTLTERAGDILHMLRGPSLEGRISKEAVLASQVRRCDTGELYHDDARSQVLVLGDSFLRIYQTDEPGAAGFIAHLSKELRRPVASLVDDGGASTLVRQELQQRPAWLANKQVVIWEFVERDIGLGVQGWREVPLPAARTAPAAP